LTEWGRHEVRYWAEAWQDELGPTWVVRRHPAQKPVGRPERSLEESRTLLRLRVLMAAFEAAGRSKGEALDRAMDTLNWDVGKKEANFDRLYTMFCRRRRN
jgi:hypothetical protein